MEASMRSRFCCACLVVLTTGFGVLHGAPGSASDIFVTTTADVEADDGLCSFREAATASNTDTASGALPGECPAGGLGDHLYFALPAGSVIALTFQPVTFTQGVTIWGPGSEFLEIAQAGSDRVLIFDGSTNASFEFNLFGVRLSGGVATTEYQGDHLGEGGAVLALRFFDMTIADVVFAGNTALNGGGALYLDQRTGGHGLMQDSAFESNSVLGGVAGGGGAILAKLDGDFTMRRVLFADNHASNPGFGGSETDDGQGGAIWLPPLATGILDILACTFSGNSAAGNGGAISFGTVSAPGFGPFVDTRIIDSTLTQNGADSDGDAPGQSGGALNLAFTGATVTLTNSIVAGNFDNGAIDFAPDLVGTSAALLASGGSNLIGIRRGAGPNFLAGLPNAAGDWVGSFGSPLDAGLEPLAVNGGFSRSHMPSGSPLSFAIDRGSCTTSVFDQRDWRTAAIQRIYDDAAVVNPVDGCDIGAIERGLEPPAEIFVDSFDWGSARSWSGIVGWIP
jgi:predicted outer membrane repeat protein